MRARIAILPLLATVFLVSCQKGDTGPAGPAGPTGPAGAAGAAGATGAQGPAGTANVIYSQWFTPASYVKDTVFGLYGFSYTKATTDITQQVIDSGVILTYGKLNGYNPTLWPTNQVIQLPITILYDVGSTTYIDVWSATETVGNLKIRLVDNLNAYGSVNPSHQFRYIIIPGGKKSTVASAGREWSSGSGRQLDDGAGRYSRMSYQEVCNALGIPE